MRNFFNYFLCALIVVVVVLAVFSPFMQSPFRFKVDPEIERVFHLRKEKQRLDKNKSIRLKRPSQKWWEVEETNEERFEIHHPGC